MTRTSMKRILVLNVGSATVKGALLDVDDSSCFRHDHAARDLAPGSAESEVREVVDRIFDELLPRSSAVHAVGHRFVHGGDRYGSTVEFDADLDRSLDALRDLAPLHNPIALAGIRAARERIPHVPHIVVFDTGFHSNRKPESTRYALPSNVSKEYGLRRFGFHGIAHAALTESLARATGVPTKLVTAVTLQLGSGCSACAVREGQSVETTMGFSPLGGLPMATRPGDLDPGVLLALLRAGWSPERLERLLSHDSGLQGLAGRSRMEEVLELEAAGDPGAALAIAQFVRAVVMTTGAYLTLLDGAGAIVFGGGIGTHSPSIRERISRGLSAWDVELRPDRNTDRVRGLISRGDSRPVYVFETDEEQRIARQAFSLLQGEPG
jgi:acetate kinase